MSQIANKFLATYGLANGIATLDSGGKVPVSQLPNSVIEYQGTWNAATNTPTLANGTGTAGFVYITSVAGTTNFGAGPITFAVGDWAIYNGSIWQKSINSNAVDSVNGFTGAVVLTTTDISEGSNFYFTNARAQAAITGGASSITTTDLTVSKALVSDGLGKVAVSTTSSTELGYVAGVTSAIQTQLDGKASTTLNNLGTTAINASLIPNTTNSIALGTAAKVFLEGYINTLRDVSGTVTVNLTSRALVNSGGGSVVNWNAYTLSDSSAAVAANWNSRQLKATDGTTTLVDWSGTDVSLNTHKLTNVVNPTSAQDAATKNYVDGLISGGRVVTSISSPTTLANTANVTYVYFVSGTTTATLPTAVGNTSFYVIKNTGVATVTIATTSSQTIDGSTSASLPVANTSLSLLSDGSNWQIV